MVAPYYQDDAVTIYHGDTRDVLPSISDVQCTITSPPYNTLGNRVPKKGTGKIGRRMQGWLDKLNTVGYADDMSESEYAEWQSSLAGAIASASAPNASYFYNHKVRWREKAMIHPIDLVRAFDGWTIRQEVIWHRPAGMTFNARLFCPNDERIYWMVRSLDDFVFNDGSSALLSVWSMMTVGQVKGHPCPFPDTLPMRCISATTSPGDTILDPFMGSGTTLRAAKDLGRKAIGIEIEERYCEIAANRMSQTVMDLGGSHA